MKNLLRTEWLKLKGYPAFWLLLGICVLSYPGINYISVNIFRTILEKKSMAGQMVLMFLGDPFAFPEVWRTTAFFSSFFVFIPAVLVIMLISNEFNFKTHRQNIIDGWSRKQFMLAKLLDVLLITVLLTFFYSFTAFFIGLVQSGDSPVSPVRLSYYVLLFALQTFSQLSLAFLVGLLVRKSFIAMAIFLFYGIILEPAFVNLFKYKWLKNDIGRFFPMELSDRLLPPPAFMSNIDQEAYDAMLASVQPHIGYTILLVVGTWALAFYLFLKRDL